MAATVQSDISANVWKILVVPGDAIDEGDSLMILESMKREIPVIAESPGVVITVHVSEGDGIDPGQPLVDLSTD